MIARTRLAALIASVGLLAFALIAHHAIMAIVGASVYVLGSAIGLRATYCTARAFQAGVADEMPAPGPRSLTEHLGSVLNGVILFGGLIAFIIGGDGHDSPLFLPGAIIWLGGVAIWFVAGIIVREVAGIPLRMGYGGWRVEGPRAGRPK